MTDYSPSSASSNDVKYFYRKLYEQVLSQNDTLTLSDFIDTEDLKKAVVIKNLDGSEVSCTVANNVVTITGAGTSMECTIFAFGRRA